MQTIVLEESEYIALRNLLRHIIAITDPRDDRGEAYGEILKKMEG